MASLDGALATSWPSLTVSPLSTLRNSDSTRALLVWQFSMFQRRDEHQYQLTGRHGGERSCWMLPPLSAQSLHMILLSPFSLSFKKGHELFHPKLGKWKEHPLPRSPPPAWKSSPYSAWESGVGKISSEGCLSARP